MEKQPIFFEILKVYKTIQKFEVFFFSKLIVFNKNDSNDIYNVKTLIFQVNAVLSKTVILLTANFDLKPLNRAMSS